MNARRLQVFPVPNHHLSTSAAELPKTDNPGHSGPCAQTCSVEAQMRLAEGAECPPNG